MSEEDRVRWDARHSADVGRSEPETPGVPSVFIGFEDLFPREGFALDLACGGGAASVWLAGLGLDVCGIDVSPVAIERARRLAAEHQVDSHCRFEAADLDEGLPSGPAADVIVCHMFRDKRLYRPITERLKRGGVLAIAVLSEVGAAPGPFRARAGELRSAFQELTLTAAGEGEGRAWLLGRK